MSATELPTRVSRHGGAVKTFKKDRTAYKVVNTDSGVTIAHLTVPPGGRVVFPHSESGSWNKTHVRADRAIPVYFENGEVSGWAPIARNTEYRVGVEVRADLFNDDPFEVSAGGIHMFSDHRAAEQWMNTADIP